MASYNGSMASMIAVDKAGRIVLPKAMRDELQLTAGDTLEAEVSGEKITLRPVRGNSPLRKKRGVWVYSAGLPLPENAAEETLLRVRHERDEQNVVKSR